MRLLYERTALVYREIAARTGVAPATIRSWAAADDWQRPPGAATARLRYQKGMPPHRLKGVPLARRMREIAERYVTDMERDPGVDLGGLSTAFKLLEMAREEEQAAYRRRKPFIWRARVAAERLLDHMERHPEESDHHDLGWVVEMLRVIKIEEERRKRRRERDKDE